MQLIDGTLKDVNYPEYPAGGGRVGALMRTHDWATSPLGSPASWPRPLHAIVDLLLHSRFPMFVAWGESLGFLYNDAYAEILGDKHPRALGIPFREIWAEIWSDISPLIDAAMNGESTYREDLPLLMNRKGYAEQTWFTFSYSPVRGNDGKVAGMFCAVCETTQKVLAERQLRELNETLEHRVSQALSERKLLADIVEGTNAFVQVVDLDFRWLGINEAAAREFERIFGRRPRAGLNMLDLLADQPDHQKAVKDVWSRALAGEEFTAIEEFGDPSLDRRAYEMRYSTLRDRDGNRIGAYQFVYDVTERLQKEARLRHAEDALRHAQKLESLGQLTGGVAHDFNNLLAVFANGVHLLERRMTQEQQQRILEGMRKAVSRGAGLTRHLLAFSRRRPVHPESVDIGAHLSTMHDMLHAALRGDVQVVTQIPTHLWAVEIDTGEFELAILNLCVNARDAMSRGGTITISADNEQEQLENLARRDFVRLSVADTGCGMSPEVLARAFEPFFTTKDVNKGSGLGLPQVYGFAQQSGGRISIHSEVGVGTTVTLLLPRTTRPPTAKAASPVVNDMPRSDTLFRGNVLLIEDDNEVAALTREMLRCVGFSVIHASSSEAALGALADGRDIQYVFSDIMMPGTNGVELAQEIKRRRPQLRIVLTTGYPEAAAGVDENQFGLVLKPYTLEALMEAFGISN